MEVMYGSVPSPKLKKSSPPPFHGALKFKVPSFLAHRCPLPLDEVDGLDHLEAELDAALGVVDARHGQPRHAVVAVAQQLDPQAVALLEGNKTKVKCKIGFMHWVELVVMAWVGLTLTWTLTLLVG